MSRFKKGDRVSRSYEGRPYSDGVVTRVTRGSWGLFGGYTKNYHIKGSDGRTVVVNSDSRVEHMKKK